MGVIDIHGVSVPEASDALVAYALDEPRPGSERDTYVVHFVGWVIGRSSKAVTLEVLNGEKLVRTAPIDRPRDDVVAAYPGVPHVEGCGFQVLTGLLGLPLDVVLTLRVALEDGTRAPLAAVRLAREAIGAGLDPALQPIVVSCLGRTGSTLLMKMLASHPEVVVLRRHPYESGAARYWVHVLRVLSQPANWMQSTHPDTFAEDPWAVGSHPFYDEGVAATPELDAWIGGTYVSELARFCQRSIDEWYRRVARSQGQEGARCFAEKHMWPGYGPALTRELYPRAKEIFLVRDFRDIVRSILAFDAKRGYRGFRRTSGKTDEQYVRDDLSRAVAGFVQGWKARAGSSHLVRYEDMVAKPAETLSGLLGYLELDAGSKLVEQIVAEASQTDSQTRGHMTSASLEQSVGRWREPQDGALNSLCAEVFGDSLELFGYDRSPSPSARAAS